MSRAPRVYAPMAGRKVGRRALFYVAMLLADAAVVGGAIVLTVVQFLTHNSGVSAQAQ